MHRSGFSRMDKEIQKDLREAEATGDPEIIKAAHKRAREHYSGGIGSMIGGVLGVCVGGPVGMYIGSFIGSWIGYNSAD